MVSTSVSIVFALSFISFGSAYHFKRESGYDQVVRCINETFHTEILDDTEDVCYYEIMDPCIDDLEKHAKPGTEPVLDLFVAYMWQELTFVKKQGLCKEVSSEDLKKYALASEVMTRHNLINIEHDPNDKCAKRAFFECFFREGNQHASYLKQADAYLKCEETKGEDCGSAIWKHYHATVDAWRKEFKNMHGKFV